MDCRLQFPGETASDAPARLRAIGSVTQGRVGGTGETDRRRLGCGQERRPEVAGLGQERADRKPQASAEAEVAFQAGRPGKGREGTQQRGSI